MTLRNGKWVGEPEPGFTARPEMSLSRDIFLVGDVEGDGNEEAVVLLTECCEGTGIFSHLVVMGSRAEKPFQLGSAFIGDRVDIRSARFENGAIILDVVQAEPHEGFSYPTQLATRHWVFREGKLEETASKVTGRLTLAEIEGVDWMLERLSWDDDERTASNVTLSFKAGRVAGSTSCDPYSGNYVAGERVGLIEINQPAFSTRRTCPDFDRTVEHRYVEALKHVSGWSFVDGQLVLTARLQTVSEGLVFRRPAGE